MLKKPYLAIANPTIGHILSSKSCTRHSLNPQLQESSRQYATHSETPPQDTDDYIWPRSTISGVNPTPYEILQVKRNATYTKHCYYRLVKIYHPDRDNHITNSSTSSTLPAHIRIERYRLVVAAHEILSDPEKRKAYDSYGKGWTHQSPHNWHRKKKSGGKGHTDHHSSFTGFNSPFANATWEDWEKWYQRQHGKQPPQEPVYISNAGFVLTVLGAVVIGAVGQRMTVEGHEQFFREQADKSHEKAMRYFDGRDVSDRPGQIQRFLKQRAQSGYSTPEPVEERKALPPPSSPSPTMLSPPPSGRPEGKGNDDHG